MKPFSDNPGETVGSISEVELIRLITEWLGPVNPPSPEGIGDDCAVYDAEADHPQLVTTDPVIHGVHFDDSVEAESAGEKLLKRNVSDIAAMGGRPLRAVLSLSLPPATRTDWLRRFIQGIRHAAGDYSVSIVGGDVSRGDGLLAGFLTLIGDAPAGRVLTRRGARIGDRLLVTGELGGSRFGHHTRFTPRVEEGRWLAAQPQVRAMIDVSDGLAKDLPALLPPGGEAELDWDALPVRAAAAKSAEASGKDPAFHALCDGEDYELLFALDGSADTAPFVEKWKTRFPCPLTVIGQIVAGSEHSKNICGIRIPPDRPGGLRAYEHFGT